MSMNYEERAEMRQLEIRIERLEKELNELKAIMAKKKKSDKAAEAAETAVIDPNEGAEIR